MSQGPARPDREQILATLGRIERSKGFRRSLRMTRFLRFVVEGALDGRIDDLRESVLGIEVFDRGNSFDPSIDNIVRVDAARLRSKLADYYANEGAGEPVRIELPKGGYVPEFRPAPTAPAPRPPASEGHPSRRSIAVIPFVGRGAQDAADMLTDALAASLGRVRGLRIASRGSVDRFRDGYDPAVVAKELGAGAVLEGSVRRSDDTVHVTVQLADTRDGFQVWADRLVAETSDPAWPDSLADHIAERLRVLLLEGKCPSSADSLAAHQLCEQAFRHLRRRTTGEIAKAISFFEAAAGDDPEYAWPYEGLASCRAALAELGYGPAARLLEKAGAEARRALSLDAASAGALVAAGVVDLLGFRLEQAEKRARAAMRANPDSAEARTLLGRVLALGGEPAEALEELERAVGLDPNDERARQALAWELCFQGDCEEALQQAQAAAYFEPGLHGPHVLAAAAHCVDGLWEEAFAELDQADSRAPGNPWTQALRAYALGRSGDLAGARALADGLAERASTGEISRVCVAAARLGLEENERAQADLDAAIESRDPQLELLRLPLFGALGKRPLPLP